MNAMKNQVNGHLI